MRVVLNKNNRLKVLRARLQMSQAEFAKSFNLSLRTVQEWEQGRHKPDKIAQNLLRLIAADPKGAMRILAEGPAE
ncbi:MAG: helix-turn-helix domain-containing protein [Rhodospirillaceae bacterium]|nr:helix-turn-helix domain-containing protein [Rhodospirillaceae bacterium]